MDRAALLLLALLVTGCSSERPEAESGDAPPNQGDERSHPAAAAPSDAADPLGIGFPAHDAARPTTLRITNGRVAPIRLVVSHGPGQPFAIEPRDGEPRFWLGSEGPLVATESCDCRCGFGCLECEPPLHPVVSVAPGESFDFQWSGRVRVGGDRCFHPYGAPAGPRTFTACLDDLGAEPRDCVTVEVELPTSLVELRFAAD